MSERFNHKSKSEWTPRALSRAAAFTHLDDVVRDPGLTTAEKKAILASWSSDARAVENAPSLRRLDSGAVVELDAILRALVLLDRAAAAPRQRRQWPLPRRSVISKWLRRARRLHSSNDDDDDPPPAPAGIAIPFRPAFIAAHGRRAEILPGSAYATR